MNSTNRLALFLSLITATPALSAEVTVRTEKQLVRGQLQDETFSVKPHLGALSYTDSAGGASGRMAFGAMVDWNMVTMNQPLLTRLYLGPSIGIIASHLGEPSSNAFGTNPEQRSGQTTSNLFLVPLNIKTGFAYNDQTRLGFHLGLNGVYRTVGTSTNIGEGSDSTDSDWNVFPNLGADFDFTVSPRVALSLRPDWTLTPENDLFAATLGVGIFLN